MILFIHNIHKTIQILDLDKNIEIEDLFQSPIHALLEIAKKHPDRILIWCHESQKSNLALDSIKASFYIKNIMYSYSLEQYLPLQIGYIEDSPFIGLNKDVKYPTWSMSSDVGAIYASQLLKFKNKISIIESFDYALNSIAKLGMPNGLLCYSEPNLLKEIDPNFRTKKITIATFFKFVKQHYKTRWTVLLLLNFILYENKFPIISFLKSLFYKKKSFDATIKIENVENDVLNDRGINIDVIIPTIGRKTYLYNVLQDLSKQTLLPKQVIIIEQSPDVNNTSELNYLLEEKWPFKITHHFTNKIGACNARNIALNKIISEYVFFADDDIRLNKSALHGAINCMYKNKFDAITLSCLLPDDIEKNQKIFQWTSFGSGCSIVKSEALSGLAFDIAFEHGFGEDSDFGMQLRNKGIDILYVPHIKLVHLKAPIGGFRTKQAHTWQSLKVQPKPSPTVMLNRIKNNSKYQLLGYKTVLFFKYYKAQKIRNPIFYYRNFKKQWEQSVSLADQLKT